MATQVKDEQLQPRGFQQISGAAAATSLTVPSNARYALIQVLSQSVRWRDDGTAPTASVGMQILAGDHIFYTGELGHIRFIEEAVGAEINVSYYS